jgi:predicted nucleic acid-binding protein
MIVLDTNVVSELMKAVPDDGVERWLAGQPAASVFLCAVTEAELRYGLALLPDGRRRTALAEAMANMLEIDFAGRILPFDSAAAVAFAKVAAERRLAGRPISQLDAQLAAVARSRTAAMATRNVADFEGCGIEVINPWRAGR